MVKADSIQLQLVTPAEVQRGVALRARSLRLLAGLKQSTLAARAGVPLSSLRRFEQRGGISLKNLLRISAALGRLDDFADLLQPPPAATMADLEASVSVGRRKRGST